MIIVLVFAMIQFVIINVIPVSLAARAWFTEDEVVPTPDPAPLTDIRVDQICTSSPDGKYKFGQRVSGDYIVENFRVYSPNLKGGVFKIRMRIGDLEDCSEGITQIELQSALGNNSEGESVELAGFGPEKAYIILKFTSKPNHPIDFKANAYFIRHDSGY